MSSLARFIKQATASLAWQLSGRRRRQGCIVLMYHRLGHDDCPFPHLGVSEFRRQLEWLGKHANVIEPDALRDGATRAPTARPPILLTFDDGTRDYYELAYPVLKAFGMPAVVFPITDYIDRPRLPWYDLVDIAIQRARVESVILPWRPDRRLPLGPDRGRVVHATKQHLKSVRDDEKERHVETLLAALEQPALEDLGRPFMTWDEIRLTMDLTTYGGHTHTHPLMDRIDSARLVNEVRACRQRLRAETRVSPRLFAYPNGNFTSEAKQVLAREGFDTAFTTTHGINDQSTDWLEVRRIGVGNILPTVWMMTNSWSLTPRTVAEVPA